MNNSRWTSCNITIARFLAAETVTLEIPPPPPPRCHIRRLTAMVVVRGPPIYHLGPASIVTRTKLPTRFNYCIFCILILHCFCRYCFSSASDNIAYWTGPGSSKLDQSNPGLTRNPFSRPHGFDPRSTRSLVRLETCQGMRSLSASRSRD